MVIYTERNVRTSHWYEMDGVWQISVVTQAPGIRVLTLIIVIRTVEFMLYLINSSIHC